MNFAISMIPITNTELALLSRQGATASSLWAASAMEKRTFAGQPLVEQSYHKQLMPLIIAALGLPPERAEHAICLSAHELAAACSRFTMAQHQSMPVTGSRAFIVQASNTVCAALVHWCPHVYITIDMIASVEN